MIKQKLSFLISVATLSFIAYTQPTTLVQGPPGPVVYMTKPGAGYSTVCMYPAYITEPGSYVLMSNLNGMGDECAIIIACNDVTLDLNGFTIQGPGPNESTKAGIKAMDQNSIVIKNGIVWGFSVGIDLDCACSGLGREGLGIQILNVTTSNNGFGIQASGGIINQCVAHHNAHTGIEVQGCTVTHCTTNGNGTNGLTADGSMVSNCTANFNVGIGISAYQSLVSECITKNNSAYGLSLGQSYARENLCVNNGTAPITRWGAASQEHQNAAL